MKPAYDKDICTSVICSIILIQHYLRIRDFLKFVFFQHRSICYYCHWNLWVQTAIKQKGSSNSNSSLQIPKEQIEKKQTNGPTDWMQCLTWVSRGGLHAGSSAESRLQVMCSEVSKATSTNIKVNINIVLCQYLPVNRICSFTHCIQSPQNSAHRAIQTSCITLANRSTRTIFWLHRAQ